MEVKGEAGAKVEGLTLKAMYESNNMTSLRITVNEEKG